MTTNEDPAAAANDASTPQQQQQQQQQRQKRRSAESTASSSHRQHKLSVSGDLRDVVRGTAESVLSKLEGDLEGAAMAEGEEGEEEEEVLQATEPGPLPKEGRDVEEVLNVISQSIYREAEGHLLMKLSDRTSLLSVVSHSLSAYITTLEPAPLQRLSARIATEVGLWMCRLFKFGGPEGGGAAYCHDDTREGLVKVARLALHRRYPKMATDGFEALFSRPPVVYLTSSTYQDSLAYVCRQLGLPLSCVRLIKLAGEEGASPEQEVEKMIQEDKAAGRMPVLCVANVHSSIIQGTDVCAFEEMCRRQDVWLHLEGNALAGLVLLPEQRKSKKAVPTGDSMALTLGSWIGVPAVPFVTLYRSAGEAAQSAGLATLNPSVRLNCLPLWCVLRSLGEARVQERIESVFQVLEVLNNRLAEFPSLRVLSQRSAEHKFVPVSELAKPDFDPSLCYRTVNPALAFQFVSDTPPEEVTGGTAGAGGRVPAYFNNLNSWLGQTMQRDCPQVPLEIVDVETTGYVLRLCPFESLAFSAGTAISEEDLAAFIECIDQQTSILNATVLQREKFIQLISKEPRLEHVDITHWAGLGGVRYVPSELIDNLEKMRKEEEGKSGDKAAAEVGADQVRRNLLEESGRRPEVADLVDHRNIQLVQKLRSSDSAFSLGEGPDGRICIRFGMVSMETDVEELLKLVTRSGMELDEQLAQLENMSEVIRRGIEQAQGELQKESDEAIWQEGILRHVPLVGSFYNWMSPLQRPQIKGRTLNLQEGKLESTEKVYKRASSIPNGGVDNPGLEKGDEGAEGAEAGSGEAGAAEPASSSGDGGAKAIPQSEEQQEQQPKKAAEVAEA